MNNLRSLSIEISLPTQGLRVWSDRRGEEQTENEVCFTALIENNSPAAEAPRAWHYLQADRKRIGPVTTDRLYELLEEGILDGQSLVWSKEMSQWSAAISVSELRPMLEDIPPPAPASGILLHAEPPPIPLPSISNSIPWTDYGVPWNSKIQYGEFVDRRDGRRYRTVQIGKQRWFAQNLAFGSADVRAYKSEFDNFDKYGGLYNWNTAMRICPEGWHLPTDQEWMELEIAVGMDEKSAHQTGWRTAGDVGFQLKSAGDWYPKNGQDKFGFRALPAGVRDGEGEFNDLGRYSHFWSGTPDGGAKAWRRFIPGDGGAVARYSIHKSNLLSVRCVEDAPC